MPKAVNYFEHAKEIIVQYYNSHLDKGTKPITADDVYVVWFCKTLQNWKALLSTNVKDGRYYEVTHNGDEGETYVDVYVKIQNVCVLD